MTPTRVHRAPMLLVALLGLLAPGCATTAPRAPVRDATPEERATVARQLIPLLLTSGMWIGPADGCAAALGVQPSKAINLAVGPNSRCKFSLLITEEALVALPPDQLGAALAHEIGHVQLGHLAARKERRAAEKKTRDEIDEKSTMAGAAVTAIPFIGPLLAVGVAATQMAATSTVEGGYRAHDRAEEDAADLYGRDLLERVIGHVRACHAEVALLQRLAQAKSSGPWATWLRTHPSPSERLKAVRETCPA